MRINKDELKNNLLLEDVEALLAHFGGDPINKGDHLVSRTICHGGDSHKLFYYDNTKLFRCFTHCEESTFDIFDLVRKVQQEQDKEMTLGNALYFVANFFGIIISDLEEGEQRRLLADWKLLKKYDKIKEINNRKKIVELNIYDEGVLTNLPNPTVLPWVREGIKASVMEKAGIRYDPIYHGIVIPHKDVRGELVGIRQRTLVKEREKMGKYLPAILNGRMYNHPLGFNLYNLDKAKENIKRARKAILFEAEKSCLKLASLVGADNDISVATCGSNLIDYQVKLLLDLGVEEIIVGFDKQFERLGDKEWETWTRKLRGINRRVAPYCKISFLFDKENILKYKSSPIDEGEEKFMELIKKRVVLENEI